MHVIALGLSGPEGDNVVAVDVVRLMLTSGDAISIGDMVDEAAEVRKGRCLCGYKTVRVGKLAGDVTDPLLMAPTCP